MVRNVEQANQVIRAHTDLLCAKLEQEAMRIFEHLISRTEPLIKITCNDPAADLILPLVNDVANQALKGTTAVQRTTNEQALLVMRQ